MPVLFLVVSVTEIMEPATALAGAVRAETIRSGPMAMGADAVLLTSLVSKRRMSASALAITK